MNLGADKAAPQRTSIVVGLGKTGLSCARYLAARGDRVIVTDSRERPPGLAELERATAGVELRLGGFDEATLGLADRLVVSPGVSLQEPFVAAAARRRVAITSDIDLFAEVAAAPIVAVTGSNGKSTVTTLVAAMMEESGTAALAGGNLGVPALDLLDQPVPAFYVLELSSFQLERTAVLAAAVAAVLNVSPDHLDRHADFAAYAAAKARVYRNCGIAVGNRDDANVAAMAAPGQRTISFGLDAPAAGQWGVVMHAGEEWIARGSRRCAPVAALQVGGRHNLANVLAALAIGTAAGLPEAPMLSAARVFRGLPHRTQLVAESAGMRWVDDSKATNVAAAVAAVEGVGGPVVLIAGGDGKGADFAPLVPALRRHGRAAVLLGRDARQLETLLAALLPTRVVANMDEAVATAAEFGRRGDTVLLAPACSSLDMYASYVARGQAFAAAVHRSVT